MIENTADSSCQKLIWDRMENTPCPGEHSNLFGHDRAVATFTKAFQSGRIHHAWLVTGMKGIGKATLAFTLTGQIFRNFPATQTSLKWAGINDDDPVFSRIAKGAHPNLLHLSRRWDEKKKSFSNHLTVDEIRRAAVFFGTSAGEDNWRICIVDTADDMNVHAANALLKVLEEPPERTVFFVLANSPGRLLATIRSRCRRLSLNLLDNRNLHLALNALKINNTDMNKTDREVLTRLCGGSVRKAITLLRQDGLPLYRLFHDILGVGNPLAPDWSQVHKLADELSVKNRQDQYRLLFDIAQDYINEILRLNTTRANFVARKSQSEIYIAKTMLSKLSQMCEVWQKIIESNDIAESYNLDKKQIILNLFGSLAKFGKLNAS